MNNPLFRIVCRWSFDSFCRAEDIIDSLHHRLRKSARLTFPAFLLLFHIFNSQLAISVQFQLSYWFISSRVYIQQLHPHFPLLPLSSIIIPSHCSISFILFISSHTGLKIICIIIRRTYPISVDVLLYGHNASQVNRVMNVQYSLLNFFSFVLACIAQVL